MERIALSFLAGAATITLAVFATGAYTVTFFSLGFAAAIAIGYLLFRMIGSRRLAAWLMPAAHQVATTATRTRRQPRPVDDDTLYARYKRMPKKEKMRAELDAWNEAFERDIAAPAASPEAVRIFSRAPAVEPQGALEFMSSSN